MIAQCHCPIPDFLPPIPLTHLSRHGILAYHCRIALSATTTGTVIPWQRKHRERNRDGDVVFLIIMRVLHFKNRGQVKKKKGALTIASAEQKRATISLFLLRTTTRPLIIAYSTGAGG